MLSGDVLAIYAELEGAGVTLWVDGGWGIDALVGRQTRPHKDLDVMVGAEHAAVLRDVLTGRGFSLKEVWPENRWISGDVPTAFVLHDADGREVDVHVVRRDDDGRILPAWDTDFSFGSSDFEGAGIVDGRAVRCMSAAFQVATHAGYELQDKDRHDLELLRTLDP